MGINSNPKLREWHCDGAPAVPHKVYHHILVEATSPIGSHAAGLHDSLRVVRIHAAPGTVPSAKPEQAHWRAQAASVKGQARTAAQARQSPLRCQSRVCCCGRQRARL